MSIPLFAHRPSAAAAAVARQSGSSSTPLCSNGNPASSCARIDVSWARTSAKPTRSGAGICISILYLSRISATERRQLSVDQAVRHLFEHATLVIRTEIASLRLRLLRAAPCTHEATCDGPRSATNGTATVATLAGTRWSARARHSRCRATSAKYQQLSQCVHPFWCSVGAGSRSEEGRDPAKYPLWRTICCSIGLQSAIVIKSRRGVL
jgi:hypothetical protein